MICFFNRKSAAFFLTLFLSTQAAAVTVYDVIQLSDKAYSNDDIIALIKATNSAFELKADDIARLNELGVNEPIIQAMIKAAPPTKIKTTAATNNKTTPVTSTAPDVHSHAKKHDNSSHSNTATGLQLTWSNIRPEALDKISAGGFNHQAITYSNIQLFVLKDRGRYASLVERSKTVANQLVTVSSLNGTFTTSNNGIYDTVVFTNYDTLKDVTILEVTPHDAKTYQGHGKRKVTPELLSAYWSNLLTDYWSLAFNHEAPQQLVKLTQGKALQALYKGIDDSIRGNSERLAQSFRKLKKQEQNNLVQLATSIPNDFTAEK